MEQTPRWMPHKKVQSFEQVIVQSKRRLFASIRRLRRGKPRFLWRKIFGRGHTVKNSTWIQQPRSKWYSHTSARHQKGSSVTPLRTIVQPPTITALSPLFATPACRTLLTKHPVLPACAANRR